MTGLHQQLEKMRVGGGGNGAGAGGGDEEKEDESVGGGAVDDDDGLEEVIQLLEDGEMNEKDKT